MKQKIVFAYMADKPDSLVSLDMDALIEHRMQVLANSGSGKSYIVRSILENSNGMFQQIIISPKKEFVTLREKFPYLHVGKSSEITKPDIELNTRYASQLALKLLEVGKDAIIEFSQFPQERVKWVKNFIEGLMSAPEHLWHPVMIVIDEIDIWAPERGHGEAESLGAIVDLAARGRDKGFFLVAVTQKLPKFNKDVASELDIKLVGKVSLDTDQTRAAQELGIPVKQKGDLRWLGAPNYYFYAFGPGLSDEIIKIQSLSVKTTHISGYKKNKNYKPIPTPDAVKAIIAQFADLPQEAEKELKTKEDLMHKIKEQSHEIATLKRVQPTVDPKDLEKSFQRGYHVAEVMYRGVLEKIKNEYGNLFIRIDAIRHSNEEAMHKLSLIQPIDINSMLPKSTASVQPINLVKPIYKTDIGYNDKITQNVTRLQTIVVPEGQVDLKPTEFKVLEKILQRPDHQASVRYVALMSGYAWSGGGFANIISKLKTSGFITKSGDMLIATDLAIRTITNIEPMPTNSLDIVKFWMGKLSSSEGKVFHEIAVAYPDAISRADVAGKTGYVENGGGFSNILSKLRTLGLIEYLPDKMLKMTQEIMDL